jgi:uncharacterized membrane protein
MREIRKWTPNPVSAARILNLGGAWYSIGMRCVYLSFPVILWFFGDWVMFATGMALLPVMYWLDFRSEIAPPDIRNHGASETRPKRV